MANNLEIVNAQLAPLIQKIKNHTIYAAIDSIENLRIFMEYHVLQFGILSVC